MSRNCYSGIPVVWLLLLLPTPSYLTSPDNKSYEQNNTLVCSGQQARFRWMYEVKPFLGLIWTHNKKLIVISQSLLFSPEAIKLDQFKGRITFETTDPFSFTLDNATKWDNGTYECVFAFDNGTMDSLVGTLKVKDFVIDNSLVEEVEKKDRCVTLKCKAEPLCTWTFPNGTTKLAKTIRFCWKKADETIRCESVCTYMYYPGTDPGTDPGADPINPVPIVLGVLLPITAIAVITVIIVFYKRRSRTPREQEPPGSDNLVPMNG